MRLSRSIVLRAVAVALALLTGLTLPGIGVARVASAQEGSSYVESFELTGLVERPRRFTLADLQAYPSITVPAWFGSDDDDGVERGRYTGVLLWDLLQEAGVKLDPARPADNLRKYVVVTGSDGYEAVFSYAELDPELSGAVVLVAYARDGQPLGPDRGMAQIILGSDKRVDRLVWTLVRIEVRDVDSPPRAMHSGS